MKLNQDKCHLAVSRYKYDNIWSRNEDEIILERKNQKLLGVAIEKILIF